MHYTRITSRTSSLAESTTVLVTGALAESSLIGAHASIVASIRRVESLRSRFVASKYRCLTILAFKQVRVANARSSNIAAVAAVVASSRKSVLYRICPARKELTESTGVGEFFQAVAISSVSLTDRITNTPRGENIAMGLLHIRASDRAFTKSTTVQRKTQDTRSALARPIVARSKIVAIIDVVFANRTNE